MISLPQAGNMKHIYRAFPLMPTVRTSEPLQPQAMTMCSGLPSHALLWCGGYTCGLVVQQSIAASNEVNNKCTRLCPSLATVWPHCPLTAGAVHALCVGP